MSRKGMLNSSAYDEMIDIAVDDPELVPYLSLFMKPLTLRKSEFTKSELEVMCKDPLHSPRLILYLIDSVKGI